MAQALPVVGSRPAFQPYAALDGDPQPPGGRPGARWPSASGWRCELASPRRSSEVGLTFDLGADSLPTRITVAAGGTAGHRGRGRCGPDRPVARHGATSTVRITIDEVLDVRAGFGGVGITEVTIPGVTAERTLVVPASGRRAPRRRSGGGQPDDTGSTDGKQPSRPGAARRPATRPRPAGLHRRPAVPSCFFDDGRPYCSPGLARDLRGRRSHRPHGDPAAAASYGRRCGSARAPARPCPRCWTAPTTGADVTASTTGVPDPAARPGVVADGDPATTWFAAESDAHPWLRLAWPAARQVTGRPAHAGPGGRRRPAAGRSPCWATTACAAASWTTTARSPSTSR